jgi:queuine tRNA-ribosyltransferase
VNDIDLAAYADELGLGGRVAPMARGAYAIHTAWEGHSNVIHVASGEIMHSRSVPMEEASVLYVEQPDLAGRLRGPGADPFVIWDVGLGAAANALAAIACYEREAAVGPLRPLHVVSFDTDLDPLRLTLAHKARFPYLHHGAADLLLAHGKWQSSRHEGLSWSLRQGDFFATLGAAPHPDLVFYDLFSANTHREAWDAAAFSSLFAACTGRAAEVITYSSSTRVRAGLLAAGFWVAKGRAFGLKDETTVALAPGFTQPCRYALLSAAWLARFQRSDSKFPAALPAAEHEAFVASIVMHPQFAPGFSG